VPERVRQAWAASIARPPDPSLRQNQHGEELRRRITRSLAALPGVQFLAGTDAANYPFQVMGFALVEELQLLGQNGVSPLRVMRSATSAPAAAMRAPDDFGRIRRGMRADLVLLNENPLAGAAAFESNDGVMVRGRWLSRGALDQALAGLENVYASAAPSTPPQAAGAKRLVDRARALTSRGFVFSSMILSDAAGALRRAGLADAADAVAKIADAPTTGPCAVPPLGN
jgi:hypothetical protein